MMIVNDIKQEYGIINATVSASGFSMGGSCGYENGVKDQEVMQTLKDN